MIKSLYYSSARKLLNLLAIFKYLFSFNELRLARPSSVMLVCHDVDRGFVWESNRYAQLLDSINDRLMSLGISTISVSSPFSLKSNINYKNPINVNGLMARAHIWRWFKSVFIKLHPDGNPTIRAWDSLFDKIDPVIIIGIQPTAELCIAAKARGIWVADLQHGVISDEGYYGISYRKSFDQAGWPSCILCWNHGSLTWVKNNIGHHVSALVIGNPWFNRFINRSESDRLVSSMSMNSIPVLSNRLKILISLQWGPFFEQYRPTGLTKGLLRLIKQLGKEYDWWIRVHPVILSVIGRDKFFSTLKKEFIAFPNVNWEQATDLPLPCILATVDLHVTLSSAVTIEASWFGIPTALLGDNVSDLMSWFGSEIEDGYAEIVQSEQNCISQWIQKHSKKLSKKSGVSTMKIDQLDNFINAIHVCVNSQARIEDLLGYK